MCHLINYLASTAIDDKIPLEMRTGKPAINYDFLHVFCSIAYYHVNESKLDTKAKRSLFMGINCRLKGYRLLCHVAKKFIFTRDVTFDGSTMLKQKILKRMTRPVALCNNWSLKILNLI